GHGHAYPHAEDEESKIVAARAGPLALEIFEDGAPPRFRLRAAARLPASQALSIETVRPSGARQTFLFAECDGFLESIDEIPEPHEFSAYLRVAGEEHCVVFQEHGH